MKRALVPLLAVWALLATVLAAWALLREPPPTPPADRRDRDVAEVERMRRRIQTLERDRETASGPTEKPPADAPAGGATLPTGARPTLPTDVPGLLAAYRRARAAGDALKCDLVLERLEAIGDTGDAEAQRAWLALFREASDEAEAEDLLYSAPDESSDAETMTALRGGLRALLRAPEPWRRAAAAEALLDVGRPRLDEVRPVLALLEEETDAAVRRVLVQELGPAAWGLALTAVERDRLVEAMRSEARAGRAEIANSLAHWSDDPADLALVSEQIGRATDPEAIVQWLSAYRGGVALSNGREADCREALRRFLADPAADLRVRKRALQLLSSLRPWDVATETTVRENAPALDR